MKPSDIRYLEELILMLITWFAPSHGAMMEMQIKTNEICNKWVSCKIREAE